MRELCLAAGALPARLHFDGDSVQRSKPEPDLFLQLISWDSDRRNVWWPEDAAAGIEAALAAGNSGWSPGRVSAATLSCS